MAIVQLQCGHQADVDHTTGERLVRCVDPSHDTTVEHVVAAVHTNAVTYMSRPLHAEHVEAEA